MRSALLREGGGYVRGQTVARLRDDALSARAASC